MDEFYFMPGAGVALLYHNLILAFYFTSTFGKKIVKEYSIKWKISSLYNLHGHESLAIGAFTDYG